MSENPNTVRTTIRIPKPLHAKLAGRAKKEGSSVASVARAILAEAVAPKKKAK